MPELQTYLDYNDPNIVIWRKGTPDDPYKPRNDSLPVINNLISLLEIPSETQKVQIAEFTEITGDILKKNGVIHPNEFLVDYASAIIQFHPSQEGKTLVCSFFGKGLIMLPASRIYAMISRNPDIVVTLQDLADEAQAKINAINLKISEVNNAISNAVQATDNANLAADNANSAKDNANQAAQNANNAALQTIMIPKEPVITFADIATTYPTPQNGWRVMVMTTGDIYRYDGVTSHTWQFIENYTGGSIPFVSETLDGLLHKEDYQNFIVRSIVFPFSKMLVQGVQPTLVQFPFDGEIVKAYAFCAQGGTTVPLEVAVEKISSSDYDIGGVWDNVFSTNIYINPSENKGTECIIQDTQVVKGDYFRINAIQLDNNIRGVTVQIDINIKNTQ